MGFIFDKKLVSCLFVLFVVCLCIGAVSATNVQNKGVDFTVSGSNVCANVHGDLFTGCHWKVAECKGFKLVSYEFCPSDSKEKRSLYSAKYFFYCFFIFIIFINLFQCFFSSFYFNIIYSNFILFFSFFLGQQIKI